MPDTLDQLIDSTPSSAAAGGADDWQSAAPASGGDFVDHLIDTTPHPAADQPAQPAYRYAAQDAASQAYHQSQYANDPTYDAARAIAKKHFDTVDALPLSYDERFALWKKMADQDQIPLPYLEGDPHGLDSRPQDIFRRMHDAAHPPLPQQPYQPIHPTQGADAIAGDINQQQGAVYHGNIARDQAMQRAMDARGSELQAQEDVKQEAQDRAGYRAESAQREQVRQKYYQRAHDKTSALSDMGQDLKTAGVALEQQVGRIPSGITDVLASGADVTGLAGPLGWNPAQMHATAQSDRDYWAKQAQQAGPQLNPVIGVAGKLVGMGAQMAAASAAGPIVGPLGGPAIFGAAAAGDQIAQARDALEPKVSSGQMTQQQADNIAAAEGAGAGVVNALTYRFMIPQKLAGPIADQTLRMFASGYSQNLIDQAARAALASAGHGAPPPDFGDMLQNALISGALMAGLHAYGQLRQQPGYVNERQIAEQMNLPPTPPTLEAIRKMGHTWDAMASGEYDVPTALSTLSDHLKPEELDAFKQIMGRGIEAQGARDASARPPTYNTRGPSPQLPGPGETQAAAMQSLSGAPLGPTAVAVAPGQAAPNQPFSFTGATHAPPSELLPQNADRPPAGRIGQPAGPDGRTAAGQLPAAPADGGTRSDPNAGASIAGLSPPAPQPGNLGGLAIDANDVLAKLIESAGGGKNTRSVRDMVMGTTYTGEGIDRAMGKEGAASALTRLGILTRDDRGGFSINPDAFPQHQQPGRLPASPPEPAPPLEQPQQPSQPPQPASGTTPTAASFSRPSLQAAIRKIHEDMGGGVPAEVRDFIEGGSANAFTFLRNGKMKGELRRMVQEGGDGAALMRSGAIKLTDDPSQAGGEDMLANVVERFGSEDPYWAVARENAGVGFQDALNTALNSPDPNHQLLAAIFDNLPPQSKATLLANAANLRRKLTKDNRARWQKIRDAEGPEAAAAFEKKARAGQVKRAIELTREASQIKPQTALNPSQAPTGTTWTWQGHPMTIEEDADGVRVLRDGNAIPVLPADQLDAVPADKGSIRHEAPRGESDESGLGNLPEIEGDPFADLKEEAQPPAEPEPGPEHSNLSKWERAKETAIDNLNAIGAIGEHPVTDQPGQQADVREALSSALAKHGIPVTEERINRLHDHVMYQAQRGEWTDSDVSDEARRFASLPKGRLDKAGLAKVRGAGPPAGAPAPTTASPGFFDADKAGATNARPDLFGRTTLDNATGGRGAQKGFDFETQGKPVELPPRELVKRGKSAPGATPEAEPTQEMFKPGAAAPAPVPPPVPEPAPPAEPKNKLEASLEAGELAKLVKAIADHDVKRLESLLDGRPRAKAIFQQRTGVRLGSGLVEMRRAIRLWALEQAANPPAVGGESTPEVNPSISEAAAAPARRGPNPANPRNLRKHTRPPPNSSNAAPGQPTAREVLFGENSFIGSTKQMAITAAQIPVQAAKQLQQTLAPQTLSAFSRRLANALREAMARVDLGNDRDVEELKTLSAYAEGLPRPDQIEFTNLAETGQQQLNPDLQPAADAIREKYDDMLDEIRRAAPGKLGEAIEFYMGRIFKQNKKTEGILAQIFGKKPLDGPKSFLKKRVWEYYQEALDHGAEPLTYNPVDMALLKLAEMRRFVEMQKVFRHYKRQGLIKFARKHDAAPEGWRTVEDRMFQVWAPPWTQIHEAFDQNLRDGLMALAARNGIKVDRVTKFDRSLGASGRAWGLSIQGHNHNINKFGGPDFVIAHEIGHALDDQFHFLAAIRRDANPLVAQSIEDEITALADQRWAQAMPEPSDKFKDYVREDTEKAAVIVQAYVSARQLMGQIAPEVLQRFEKFIAEKPTLKGMKDLVPSVRLGAGTAMKELPGPMLVGKYYLPPEGAQVFENLLSPSLRQKSVGVRALMGVNGLLNTAQLGLSGFHATFSIINSAASQIAVALEHAFGLRMGKAALELAKAPVSLIDDLIKGGRLIDEWYHPGNNGRVIADMLEGIVNAGGRPKMDRSFQPHLFRDLGKMWKRALAGGKLAKADASIQTLVRVPAILAKVSSWPILEYLVPRLKMAAAAKLIAKDLAGLPPRPTKDQIRDVVQRSWDTIDDRFGQVVYANRFYNNMAKDVMMLSVRSLGWNQGTVGAFGGALADTATIPWRVAARKRQREEIAKRDAINKALAKMVPPQPGIPPPPGGDAQLKPVFTHNMAYSVAALAVAAAIGAILNRLMTGEWPKEGRDYFLPRTGGLDDNGHPIRLATPTYFKDLFGFARHPLKTAGNKLSPLADLTAKMIQNKDYYGTQIYNPDDLLPQNVIDALKYAAKQLEPFSWQSYQRSTQEQEPMAKRLASFAGFQQASPEYSLTPAEELARQIQQDNLPIGGRTTHAANAAKARADLVRKLRGKGPAERAQALRDAVAGGSVTPAGAGQAMAKSQDKPLVWGVQQMVQRGNLHDALRVWQKADPTERDELRPMLLKAVTPTTLEKLDPADAPRVWELFEGRGTPALRAAILNLINRSELSESERENLAREIPPAKKAG